MSHTPYTTEPTSTHTPTPTHTPTHTPTPISNFYNNYIIDTRYNEQLKRAQQNSDDQYTFEQLKFQALKYRRIIGIVLLILLIIIGVVHANITNAKPDDIFQFGGGPILTAASAIGRPIKSAAGAVSRGASVAYQKTGLKSAVGAASKVDKAVAGTVKGIGSDIKTIGQKTGITGAAKYGSQRAVKYGEYAADKFASYSSVVYSVLYQVAFAAIICMIFMPSLVFVLGGILCLSLLKSKIAYLKGL